MSENKFQVRYSQIHQDALKDELIKRYEFNEPISCRFFDFGMNDIYVVKSGGEVYYLRISLIGIHEQKDYEEEILIINLLNEDGISVVTPVCCKDGNYVWLIDAPEGERYVVLFKEVKQESSDDNVKKSYNLGQMLANMHAVADKNNFTLNRTPIDLVQLAKKPLNMLKPFLEHRPDDIKIIENIAKELCQYVDSKLSMKKPYYGFCHGDIHTGNVYFTGDMPKIFDFDCMGFGWRSYDICVYAWNKTYGEEKYIDGEEWKAYLEGYNSIRQLSEDELASINVFYALRELWIMGLHADVMGKNAGCSWYNDGYFNYHIGILKLWYQRAFEA